MEGMFWSTMLAFAPLWAWLPCGVAQVVVFVIAFGHPWPWYLRWAPALVYPASFLPMLYGWLRS